MTVEEVRNARKSVRIADIDEFSMRAAVQDILREVATMNGVDLTLVLNVTSLLYNKLRSEYSAMTLDEIQLAFRAGTEGEFGKNYSITYATLIGWLKGYLFDRRVALVYDEERVRERRKARGKNVIGDTEKAERVRQGNIEVLRHRWQDIKEGRESFEIPQAGALAYDYLVATGLMREDSSRRREAERLADLESVHPFVASIQNGSREVIVKNIEVRLFLRELFSAGRNLIFPEVDMPSFI